MNGKAHAVRVQDPFCAALDPELPMVAAALDPAAAREAFKHGLPRLVGEGGRVAVRSIQVLRYKPGKRCVIEYGVRLKRPGAPVERAALLGKMRARRFGNEAFRLLDAFWRAGFEGSSADGVSVPEPVGVIPEFRMWLQRKVAGVVSGPLLAGPDGVALAQRIASALHKVHCAGVPAARAHSIVHELSILHRCLAQVQHQRPEWAGRIERLLTACDRLGASLPAPEPCGIHRDFYPAQVVVDGARLWLIDFDLYCWGDPALDLGNFLGHIQEESLRTLGDASALGDREQAMIERFVALSGGHRLPAIHAYTMLTLARHVYLSTQFAERRAFTEPLLELCEERLGLGPPWY